MSNTRVSHRVGCVAMMAEETLRFVIPFQSQKGDIGLKSQIKSDFTNDSKEIVDSRLRPSAQLTTSTSGLYR